MNQSENRFYRVPIVRWWHSEPGPVFSALVVASFGFAVIIYLVYSSGP